MDVLGFPVDPLQVVQRGTRHVHYVQTGVTLTDNDTGRALKLETWDTGIVCPGDIYHLLRYNDELPDPVTGGMHINLFNK